ncbi:unnamed protein product [Linum trigynum]|uniref:Endonuclease/exonuclease/phosphatase domain-containing protein n=1 Tax=Linum trigynum TaxID=586398 RepID=A0AAV2GKF2_9ROSI
MGFDKWLIVDAVGFARGIWLLWDSSIVSITEVDRSPQFLHVRAQTGRDAWFLTTVYASPALVQRRELLASIRSIAEDMGDPWFLAVDFNSILLPSDKMGGSTL